MRFPNKVKGHEQVAQLAFQLSALVCFEATGGQAWRLWVAWMMPASRRGNCRQLRSKLSQPTVADSPKPTGSTRNSVRISWLSDLMPSEPTHMESYVFSAP